MRDYREACAPGARWPVGIKKSANAGLLSTVGSGVVRIDQLMVSLGGFRAPRSFYLFDLILDSFVLFINRFVLPDHNRDVS